MKSCVAFTPPEKVGFENERHIINFSKYMISDSRRLSRTKLTCKNLITVGNLESLVYNEDVKLARQIQRENTKGLNEGNCYADLTYFAFMFQFENIWISNFISGSKTQEFKVRDEDATAIFIDRIYHNKQSDAQRDISEIIHLSEGITFIDDIPEDLRRRVNKAIMTIQFQLYPVDALLSVIHYDQERTGHIHRLIRSPNL